MHRCSLRQLMVVPFTKAKGTTTLGLFEYRHTSSAVARPVFILKWYSIPWTSDVVLNFLFLCMVSQEASPRLQPSDWWRMTLGDLFILLCLHSGKGVPILSTWAIIVSCPMRPFHFFTYVSPADVTGVESRLVYYSSLSAILTASINSAGLRGHLLCPTHSRAFSFCSVLSCYFRSACPSGAWFVLSLLHAHELPSFHPGLHQWL
jgi:hypothetical protein